MDLHLNECTAVRPDRRAIAKGLEEFAADMDASLARELTDILLEGTAVDITIAHNPSSALRMLRKLNIDYEIVE